MNITEALASVPFDKAEYFKWKFPDARFDKSQAQRTQEEFLEFVNKKTMNTYFRWEKTDEYKALVAFYLQSKTANDLQEIYEVVTINAKTGDEKAVKLFLQLNKEIADHAKMALKSLKGKKEVEEDDDGLMV